ncbi:MAG: hypothetical protein COW58_04145 [Thalassolituus sp. CG17_big_fil_post_rev_8_21_14_2_50_53_8]|nr:MAG: hypothetical protein COW58_04145 [Thalassolituus sp. CG17_big_fil_post_rev_8_21_14_2_50_53_8]
MRGFSNDYPGVNAQRTNKLLYEGHKWIVTFSKLLVVLRAFFKKRTIFVVFTWNRIFGLLMNHLVGVTGKSIVRGPMPTICLKQLFLIL